MGEFVGNTRLCSASMIILAQLMLLIHFLHPAAAHDRCCGGGVPHSQNKIDEWINQTRRSSNVNSRERPSHSITTIINVSFEKDRMNVRQCARHKRRWLIKMDASSLTTTTTTTIIVIIIMKIYVITHRRWSWFCPPSSVVVIHQQLSSFSIFILSLIIFDHHKVIMDEYG